MCERENAFDDVDDAAYVVAAANVGVAASALAPAANSDVASVADDVVVTLAATFDVVATAGDAIRAVPAPKPLTQQLSLPLEFWPQLSTKVFSIQQ
jgi:hypothetical protein